MIEVVTFGETMFAVRADGLLRLGGTLQASIAGAEATVAIGLSRLGHRSRWAGRVGTDEPGELVLRTLRAEGVDVSTVDRDIAPTGLILFEQRLPDLTRVQYYRNQSAGSRLTPADVAGALADGVRLVHFTGITPALSETARAAAHTALDRSAELSATVSFDVNYRSRLWRAEDAAAVLTPLARRAAVVIGSADEIDLVGGTDGLLRAGVREVVVKQGAEGAAVHDGEAVYRAPGHRVPVVDSVGAGDAFTGGYLSGLLDGLEYTDRLARGNAVGAFAVATSGDWEGLPTRSELDLLSFEKGAALR